MNKLFISIFLITFLISIFTVYASNNYDTPNYQKMSMKDFSMTLKSNDQIIIKLKDYKNNFKDKFNIQSLDNLNKKYEAVSVNKIFKRQKLPPGITKGNDGKNKNTPDLGLWFKIKLSKGKNLSSVIEEYRNDSNVEYVGPSIRANLFSTFNDPLFNYQWNLNNEGQDYYTFRQIPGTIPPDYEQIMSRGKPDADIDLPEAMDMINGSENETIVAVLDSGVDYTHEDLADRIWINIKEIPGNGIDDDNNGYIDDVRGWDFSDNDNDPMDYFGHGTHCAGIIASHINNSIGIAGINPKAKIMIIKVFPNSDDYFVAEAIRYAVDNGARVLSNSWGYEYGIRSPIIDDTINYAYAKGAVIVFSAGNNGFDTPQYPAASENIISVGASNSTDQIRQWSTYGPWVDLAAPGSEILSLRYGDMYAIYHQPGIHVVADKYYVASGTSMAAPHVAGLASLILSKHPEFTNDDVEQVLKTSADDIESPGWDTLSGYGRINARKALETNSVCIAKIISPKNYDMPSITELLKINISAYCNNFNNYILEYGIGESPTNWTSISSSSTPVIEGYAASLDSSKLGSGYLTIRLTVKDNTGKSFMDRKIVTMQPPQLSNWPIKVSDFIGCYEEPVIADINNDNYKEVIAGASNLFVLNYSGQLLFKTPGKLGVTDFDVPSIGDLYPEIPGKEIAVLQANNTCEVGCNVTNISYNLHILKKDGTEVSGWPKNLLQITDKNIFDFILQPTVLADVNNDGKLEIIQHVEYANEINIFNITGNQIKGWPINIQNSYNMAVGNIDNDPELEIIIPNNNEIKVFNNDGTTVNGWPKTFSDNLESFIVLADIDKDKMDEIIFSVVGWGLYVFNGDGTLAPGSWPVNIAVDSWSKYPAIADVNNDGKLEIIIQGGETSHLLYLINSDGTIASGWPRSLDSYCETSPVVGDLDGDGYQEIIAITWWKPAQIFVFRYDGTIFTKWQLDGFSFTSPALGDLNNDGNLELITTSSDLVLGSKMYAFKFEGKNPSGTIAQWPMSGNDEKHQYEYSTPCKSGQIDINGLCNEKCGASKQCNGLAPGTDCCSNCYYTDITGMIKWVPDNKVDMRDIGLVASFVGAQCEDGKYDSRIDINKDCKIDSKDTGFVSSKFGKTCPIRTFSTNIPAYTLLYIIGVETPIVSFVFVILMLCLFLLIISILKRYKILS